MSGSPVLHNPEAQRALETVLSKIIPAKSDEFYFTLPHDFTHETEVILNPVHEHWLKSGDEAGLAALSKQTEKYTIEEKEEDNPLNGSKGLRSKGPFKAGDYLCDYPGVLTTSAFLEDGDYLLPLPIRQELCESEQLYINPQQNRESFIPVLGNCINASNTYGVFPDKFNHEANCTFGFYRSKGQKNFRAFVFATKDGEGPLYADYGRLYWESWAQAHRSASSISIPMPAPAEESPSTADSLKLRSGLGGKKVKSLFFIYDSITSITAVEKAEEENVEYSVKGLSKPTFYRIFKPRTFVSKALKKIAHSTETILTLRYEGDTGFFSIKTPYIFKLLHEMHSRIHQGNIPDYVATRMKKFSDALTTATEALELKLELKQEFPLDKVSSIEFVKKISQMKLLLEPQHEEDSSEKLSIRFNFINVKKQRFHEILSEKFLLGRAFQAAEGRYEYPSIYFKPEKIIFFMETFLKLSETRPSTLKDTLAFIQQIKNALPELKITITPPESSTLSAASASWEVKARKIKKNRYVYKLYGLKPVDWEFLAKKFESLVKDKTYRMKLKSPKLYLPLENAHVILQKMRELSRTDRIQDLVDQITQASPLDLQEKIKAMSKPAIKNFEDISAKEIEISQTSTADPICYRLHGLDLHFFERIIKQKASHIGKCVRLSGGWFEKATDSYHRSFCIPADKIMHFFVLLESPTKSMSDAKMAFFKMLKAAYQSLVTDKAREGAGAGSDIAIKKDEDEAKAKDKLDKKSKKRDRVSSEADEKTAEALMAPKKINKKVDGKVHVSFSLYQRADHKDRLNFQVLVSGVNLFSGVALGVIDLEDFFSHSFLKKGVASRIESLVLALGRDTLSKQELREKICRNISLWIQKLKAEKESETRPELPHLPGCEVQRVRRKHIHSDQYGYYLPGVESNEETYKKSGSSHPTADALSYEGYYLFDESGQFFFDGLSDGKKIELIKTIQSHAPSFELCETDILRFKSFKDRAKRKTAAAHKKGETYRVEGAFAFASVAKSSLTTPGGLTPSEDLSAELME